MLEVQGIYSNSVPPSVLCQTLLSVSNFCVRLQSVHSIQNLDKRPAALVLFLANQLNSVRSFSSRVAEGKRPVDAWQPPAMEQEWCKLRRNLFREMRATAELHPEYCNLPLSPLAGEGDFVDEPNAPSITAVQPIRQR